MSRNVAPWLLLVLGCAAIASQDRAPSAASPTAGEIVKRWQQAVHAAGAARSKGADLLASSDQDGIPGRIEETLGPSGRYRSVATRAFDEAEIVVADGWARRRDWNGFVREVRGDELSRLRTSIFETRVLVFGPDPLMAGATLLPGGEAGVHALRITPDGGWPVTFYVDSRTWLPVKCSHRGDDEETVTTYLEWGEIGGVETPRRARVSEVGKPDYEWRRSSVGFVAELPRRAFSSPKARPPDTTLAPGAPEIPFDFESSHILLKASLNGRPPAWFILDTGADQNVIHEARLAEFGLSTYARTRTTGGGNSADYGYARGATFSLPGVELRNQHVAVIEQSGLERALGVPLGGILGYDFISRFVIEIDYERKLITLHDPGTWTYAGGGHVIPVVFDRGIPFARATISVPTKPNIPALFVLDSGASETMTLTSPFVKANDLVRLAGTNPTVNRPAGMESQFFAQNNVRGRIDELRLGSLTERSIPVNMSVNTTGAYASPNFSGTIGESIYRRYRVYLDYPHDRVILEPTPETDKPIPERKTYGLSLLAYGADLRIFTVTAVRQGSPAEKDGFRKGDVISAMDGKPAPEFTLGELRDRLAAEGERHRLEVARESGRLEIPVEVRLVSLDR